MNGCGLATGYVFANTVVFHLLDNNYYFAQSEDSGRTPAKKGADSCFHFEGDLVMADLDGQYAILKLCEPLWEGKNMVIVGPSSPAAARTRPTQQIDATMTSTPR